MATVGGINIRFGIDLTELHAGIKAGNKEVMDFVSRMAGLRLHGVVKGDPWEGVTKYTKEARRVLDNIFDEWTKSITGVKDSYGTLADTIERVTGKTLDSWRKLRQQKEAIWGTIGRAEVDRHGELMKRKKKPHIIEASTFGTGSIEEGPIDRFFGEYSLTEAEKKSDRKLKKAKEMWEDFKHNLRRISEVSPEAKSAVDEFMKKLKDKTRISAEDLKVDLHRLADVIEEAEKKLASKLRRFKGTLTKAETTVRGAQEKIDLRKRLGLAPGAPEAEVSAAQKREEIEEWKRRLVAAREKIKKQYPSGREHGIAKADYARVIEEARKKREVAQTKDLQSWTKYVTGVNERLKNLKRGWNNVEREFKKSKDKKHLEEAARRREAAAKAREEHNRRLQNIARGEANIEREIHKGRAKRIAQHKADVTRYKEILEEAARQRKRYVDESTVGVKQTTQMAALKKSLHLPADASAAAVKATREAIVEEKKRRKEYAKLSSVKKFLYIPAEAIKHNSKIVRDSIREEGLRQSTLKKTASAIRNVTKAIGASIRESRKYHAELKKSRKLGEAIGGGGLFSGEWLKHRARWFIQLRLYWGLYRAAGEALQRNIEYQKQLARAMRTARSEMMSSKDIAEKYGEAMWDMGTKFNASLEQSGEVLYQLGSAGLSAEEALAGLEPTIRTIISLEGDAREVTKAVAGIYNNYAETITHVHTEQEKLKYINELIITSWSRNQFEVSEFTDAMKHASVMTHAAGLSLAEVTSILAVSHNHMLKAGRSGRALTNVLMRIARAPRAFAKAFDVEVDLDKPIRLLDLVSKIQSRFDKGAVSVAKLSNVFERLGLRGAPEFTIMLQHFDEIMAEIDRSVDVSEEAARVTERKLDNIGDQFGRVVKEITKDIATVLQPVLEEVKEIFKFYAERSERRRREAKMTSAESRKIIKSRIDELRSYNARLRSDEKSLKNQIDSLKTGKMTIVKEMKLNKLLSEQREILRTIALNKKEIVELGEEETVKLAGSKAFQLLKASLEKSISEETVTELPIEVKAELLSDDFRKQIEKSFPPDLIGKKENELMRSYLFHNLEVLRKRLTGFSTDTYTFLKKLDKKTLDASKKLKELEMPKPEVEEPVTETLMKIRIQEAETPEEEKEHLKTLIDFKKTQVEMLKIDKQRMMIEQGYEKAREEVSKTNEDIERTLREIDTLDKRRESILKKEAAERKKARQSSIDELELTNRKLSLDAKILKSKIDTITIGKMTSEKERKSNELIDEQARILEAIAINKEEINKLNVKETISEDEKVILGKRILEQEREKIRVAARKAQMENISRLTKEQRDSRIEQINLEKESLGFDKQRLNNEAAMLMHGRASTTEVIKANEKLDEKRKILEEIASKEKYINMLSAEGTEYAKEKIDLADKRYESQLRAIKQENERQKAANIAKGLAEQLRIINESMQKKVMIKNVELEQLKIDNASKLDIINKEEEILNLNAEKIEMMKEITTDESAQLNLEKDATAVEKDRVSILERRRREVSTLYDIYKRIQDVWERSRIPEWGTQFVEGVGMGIGSVGWSAISGFQEQRQEVINLEAELRDLQREYANLYDEDIAKAAELNAKMAETRDRINELKDPINNIGEAFRKFFKDLIDGIGEAIAQWIAMQLVMQALGLFTVGSMTSVSGGGANLPTTAAGSINLRTAHAQGGIIPSIHQTKAFSGGGITSGPMAALLGDNRSGRELVIPSEHIHKDSVHGYVRDKEQPINVINILTREDVAAAMSGVEGERVVINHIGKDINSRGPLIRALRG